MTQLFRATTRKTIGQIMRIIRAHEVPSQLMEILGAFGVALGISAAGAAFGVLSEWSIDGLVSLLGSAMGDALRMVSSAVWHFKG